MKVFTSLFVFCLTLNLSAQAGQNEGWRSIIDALLGSGITKIGNFNLQDFRAKAEKIEIRRLSEAPPSVLSGSRQSGYNTCGDRFVHVDDRPSPDLQGNVAQLELHELMGVLCIYDDDDALSTALVTLANMRDQNKKSALAQSFAKSVFNRPQRVAGVTGVSGGGDLVTMHVKNQVLRKIMGDSENRLSATPEFLAQYALIRFEPLQSHMPRTVHLKYTFTANRREAFAVFVPMEIWRNVSARPALIDDIANKVMQLFPTYEGGQNTRTFRPQWCGTRGPTVTFPMTNDSSVRQIQDERGGLLKGCRTFDSGFTSIEIIAPALEREDMPKSAGNYHFHCVLTFGRGGQETPVTVRAGFNTIHSMSAATPAGGTLEGSVSVSKTGQIDQVLIIYSLNGSRTMSPGQKSADPLNARTEMTVEGYPSTFTCKRLR